jgi:signal transduction histidine kinase
MAIQDVRNIVEDAKPTLLEFFGLGTAIESFLAQATRNIMIEGKLTFDPPKLDKTFATVPHKQLTLYRIIQEAVNNAVRHADATEIEISYLRQQRKSEIKIKDNGCGITLGKSKPLGGMQNMKARGKLMGAQVHFDSSDSNTGTCITITFSDTVEDC